MANVSTKAFLTTERLWRRGEKPTAIGRRPSISREGEALSNLQKPFKTGAKVRMAKDVTL